MKGVDEVLGGVRMVVGNGGVSMGVSEWCGVFCFFYVGRSQEQRRDRERWDPWFQACCQHLKRLHACATTWSQWPFHAIVWKMIFGRSFKRW